jgi:hypothetical protein
MHEWVAKVMEKMETLKLGDTRKSLLRVFTTEGGLSTGLERTYVSQDCPLFKVDVKFHAKGRPDRESEASDALPPNSVRVVAEQESKVIALRDRPLLNRRNDPVGSFGLGKVGGFANQGVEALPAELLLMYVRGFE